MSRWIYLLNTKQKKILYYIYFLCIFMLFEFHNKWYWTSEYYLRIFLGKSVFQYDIQHSHWVCKHITYIFILFSIYCLIFFFPFTFTGNIYIFIPCIWICVYMFEHAICLFPLYPEQHNNDSFPGWKQQKKYVEALFSLLFKSSLMWVNYRFRIEFDFYCVLRSLLYVQ